MKSLYVALACGIILASLTNAVAQNSVWTDKTTYQVGDTISVCVATGGGKVTLVLSGPYILNVNLGDLPSGSSCFPIGQAEQRDVGSWTVAMYVSPAIYPMIPYTSSPSATSYFYVVNNATPEFSNSSFIIVVTLLVSLLVFRIANPRRASSK
jgi:hypothetical protein